MTLAHVRRGSGPPLALIHGIGSQWQMWEPVLERLSREREVVALDLPGFGDSEEHRARPTVEALADAAAEFLDGMGLGGAHWRATRSAAGSRWRWPGRERRGRPAPSPPPVSSTTARADTRSSC